MEDCCCTEELVKDKSENLIREEELVDHAGKHVTRVVKKKGGHAK